MISLHKKIEPLTFEFISEKDEYITSSKISGKNFSYFKDENNITITIDLKSSSDIDEFLIFFKELKSIKLDSERIIKQLDKIIKSNLTCSNYLLRLYLSEYSFKEYKLGFYYDEIKLHLKTKYIKG
ncbi:hypothetical protein [Aliarcobacter butzleri]|uniref:hypothetical protein n=2 Tax=Aliarcobacter butzleri TaxID=28197 RepID=UPI0021B65E10|nr:hypothetical protein [Aliarcobacter butzleri]MCT7579169.1 hypothetical protein [Aliarcobacter butzleri]MDN5090082.1 hypothetical protein [Aliarcobacter butzleri]